MFKAALLSGAETSGPVKVALGILKKWATFRSFFAGNEPCLNLSDAPRADVTKTPLNVRKIQRVLKRPSDIVPS